jgi:hypothetical protein
LFSGNRSIGSDWLRCVYNTNTPSNPFTFSGHKIINTSSPLLNCTTCSINFCANCISNLLTDANNNHIIPINTTFEEYDGTLVKTDANGNDLDASGVLITNHNTQDPVLDLPALGFFRGEIIGYDCALQPSTQLDPNPNNSSPVTDYAPFMVFQKTITSGITINVNSNRWCYDDAPFGWTGATPLKADITANMITILMNDINPFSTSTAPNSITVTPSYSNVSYSACTSGSITYTPNGIYLDQAYKIDNGFTRNEDHNSPSTVLIDRLTNIAIGAVDANCATFHALRIGSTANNENNNDNEQTDELNFSLYPNPTNSTFTLQIQTKNTSVKDVSVYNAIGTEIFHQKKLTALGTVVDLSKNPKGIYFVKLMQEGREAVKKIIYM